MATLVLSAAGAALGAGFGGAVLGLSGAVIGRALGATLGRVVDQRLLGGGSDAVEVGRIDRLRLMGASEGAPISDVWGRMRVGGQVIWATQFQERSNRRRGGKGGGPSVTQYSYSISLAVGLCKGEILRVGRIWADGVEISPQSVTMRVYSGSEDQLPDAKIEAVEGSGKAPAFRGLAYVLFEDLELSTWGNRVPQFSFEVMRAAQGPSVPPDATLAQTVRAVALIPGTGEYALATTPIRTASGLGRQASVNVNSPSGKTDFETSLDQLCEELPDCGAVSLVVSWFGSDLRCGLCDVQPKVEQTALDASNMPWRAGGITRSQAAEVPRLSGKSIYGGTPADASVVEAIRAIRDAGREVMFYPFVLMDQVAGNALTDPWSGATGQPALPWRGRITTSLAPGIAGTPDRSAAAEAEVAAFFGLAQPSDFSVAGETVSYTGPSEWRFRRFILHYAKLCAAAGGVDAFCIGSEMRGLTRARGAADSFPAVAAFRQLAQEVKAILGPNCRVSYAADWTEYGSYFADDNLYFPLDELWSDPAVDFIGIDNYMPLSDWRDGTDHADAVWETPYDLDYLMSNIAGGEGFDWFYDSPEGEAAQRRVPIEDGAHQEPWVFRVKDLRSWWSLPHHARTGGTRNTLPTSWLPMSKPIVFTEYGCAAIDKGTNQPNRFLDLLSSESALPRASNGRRDDLIQMQYLRAMSVFWSDVTNNPLSPVYGNAMLDVSRSHAWAWDCRPFPEFPGRSDLWSDASNYGRGHWLNGRATNQSLSAVIAEIAGSAGVSALDTSRAHGIVRGYLQENTQSARASLQPLMLAYGVDPAERDGVLSFRSRLPGVDHVIAAQTLAVLPETDGYIESTRSPDPETPDLVRFGFVDADGVYDARVAEARQPDVALQTVAATELNLAFTYSEGHAISHRWLAETRISRDTVRFALPPSFAGVGTGDRVRLPDGGTYRIDAAETAEGRMIEATRIEGGVYAPPDPVEGEVLLRPFVAPVPVFPLFLDLPLLVGDEVPHQPHVAATAEPWPGTVAVWSSSDVADFSLNRLIAAPSIIGVTETALAAARPGLWDEGEPLRVRVTGGDLQTVSRLAALNGANAMAIGGGSTGPWEVFQFVEAALVAPDVYDIRIRLRGQAGTDGIMPPVWPIGSYVVLLDDTPVQIDLPLNARGLSREYRVGASGRGYDDPNVVSVSAAFDGVGLRPYPVAHLRASAPAGQDLVVSWIRRTRIEGDSWQQVEVPLGEDSELYRLRVLNGPAIVAEYDTTEPLFSYPATQQAADGLTGAFTVAIAMVSQRFGLGPFRQIDIGV